MKKILAFTLAETLIVMGIIGIVSALTLPNLNSSTGEKEKVAKVKKIYSNLEDALGRAQAVYGPYDEWCPSTITSSDIVPCSKKMAERVTEFLKISKNCEFAVNKGCFSKSNVFDVDGSVYGPSVDSSAEYYKVVLADGTSLAFRTRMILIDIDGPNKGKGQCQTNMSGDFDNNYDLYAWIIYNENMDYLKCPDELNWQNQTSCK